MSAGPGGQADVRRARLAWLVLAILLLALAVNGLSAWIRHGEAGLACDDRTACYGLLGQAATAGPAAQEVARSAFAPGLPAKRAHRLLASGLVVLVLLLLARARTVPLPGPFERQAPYAIAGVVLLLAVIGPASYLKTRPAIATCNLLGGVALAALSFRLWLGLSDPRGGVPAGGLRRLLDIAAGALLLQLALGAWTSASFAGLACDTSLHCAVAPSSVGVRDVLPAFGWWSELTLDGDGRVRAGAGTVAVHLAHRGWALVAVLLLLLACWRAARVRVRPSLWLPVLALLGIQLALGLAQVQMRLPMALVLAHGGTATLLLLALLRLRHGLGEPVPARRPR